MPQSNLPTNTDGALEDEINESLMKLKLSEDPRERLRFFLGKVLRVVITDGRIIVGVFVCTDRDCNIILENSWEYTSEREGKFYFILFFITRFFIRLTS